MSEIKTTAFCPFVYVEDTKEYIESDIVGFLIGEEILGVFSVKIGEEECASLGVICNDVFAWGYADMEFLPYSEIVNLYKLYEVYGYYSGVIWTCLKRGMLPQKPMADLMKKDNAWLKELDNLEKNSYDAFLERERQKPTTS